MTKKPKFVLVSKEDKRPKCPDCWGGRLIYIPKDRVWKCCATNRMRCQREYKKITK